MFDQFKNILPTTNINIRSLSSSVGLNDEEWRARGLERLEALRSEFQNFNSILLNRQQNAPPITQQNRQSILELEATSRLIQRYEHDWQDIHDRNTVNFEKARMADQLLLQLLSTCRQHVSTGDRMEKTHEDLAAIHEDLKQLNTVAGGIKSKLMGLEDQINEATSEQSRLEFEEWKKEQRGKLNEEIADKTAQLEMYEASLRQAYEEHNQVQTQKRAELLDATFNAEMEQYRRLRETQVSSLYSHQPAASITASLDTLKLDVDNQDLDSFLSDNDEKPAETISSHRPQHPPHKQPISDDSSDEGGNNEILGDEDYEDL
ncbi:hypothetical protein RO3G_06309 [Lichtheimia corymbifera JMRC:FSU:9682]|uniref:Uncharacterized protein n=1 Tax=Lichtheimia corymbifera JMRC:FSU:9682 TaxID=1263082 RepID=A0A068SC94_9FUNG|nr:hypothetical protein RO3G_06309 [Lichtheimia corymbifera JMRC:FSU:9682]